MQEELRVTVADGKYTVVFGADCRLHALRYGEEWRDCVGDGLILALAQEVRRLQKALSDSALTALAAETQADEAYQKQLEAEKRVKELEQKGKSLWDRVVGEVVLPEAPAVDEAFWLGEQKEQQ